MKKVILLVSIVLIFSSWGKIGHRTIGEIAERQLTPEVKEKVRELLDNQSLAVVSTWADEMRSNPDFDKYGKWHYVNLPLDKEYSEIEHTQDNIVIIINQAIDSLKSETTSQDRKQFYLKYLVHMVGDLHQPLHTGREEDWGGNKIKVKFKGRNSNLHSLWDSGIIDDYKMSYTEYADKLMDKFENRLDFRQGSAEDWANESHSYVPKIYKIKEGSYLSYDYVYENQHIIDKRLFQSGTRLANLLNEIFTEK
tara:strand:- start:18436 stop:19191 length:756 start_codon:yes stop_codon:yes gene_type:complete